MALWNLGSVAEQVFNYVDDIPTTLSGTMLDLVNKRRLFMEQYLDVSVGSVDIAEKYQEPLLFLSLGKINLVIETQGGDAESYKIGEFSIKKGDGSSSLSAAKKWEENAMLALKELKGRGGYFKALG